MKSFERAINRLSNYSAIVAGAAMFMMMLQVSLDVALKYIFNYPVPATLETVSSYYMVALIFLPLGIVTRDHEHISVELFTKGLSPKWLSLVNGIAGILAIAYIGVMTYRCADEAWHKTLIGESWETALWDMQVWPSRWFIPIGVGLMLVYLLIHVIYNFAFVFRGERIMTTGEVKPTLDLT